MITREGAAELELRRQLERVREAREAAERAVVHARLAEVEVGLALEDLRKGRTVPVSSRA